ncbi:MAG: phosphopantetheine-binding protein, partial [Acidobacteriota bacterium]
TPTHWLSVNWDGWQLDAELQGTTTTSAIQEIAIRPSEGREAFKYLFSFNATDQIIVSTTDLRVRIEQWISKKILPNAVHVDGIAKLVHTRPSLQNSYVSPRNDLETSISRIWQELLGMAEVGIYDNFFELGGTSLLATQIITRIRDEFHADVPLRTLFEEPTIANLAMAVTQVMGKQKESPINRVSRNTSPKLLAELYRLSDEEVKELLKSALAERSLGK